MSTRRPAPKAISHDVRILRGPPDSINMRSGLVVLKPGESIGKHTTSVNEELIVVLQGQGTANIDGKDPFSFNTSTAMYIPPETEHDITNTGKQALRYVYVVAKADRYL